MDDLRILLLSTPKTGNTWLRNLLACIYKLPQVVLTAWPFQPEPLDRAGTCWVTHHHYFPSPELERYIRDNRVFVITTIRHPADVLISMYHHITEFRFQEADVAFLRRMLLEDFERRAIIPEPVGAPFYRDLACSIEWARSGLTRIVRYEDLRTNTFGVLSELTSAIRPATSERIEAAMDACDLGLMRDLAGRFGGFFRRGGIGEWRSVLPPDVVDTFRQTEPYRTQLAALGYSMEPQDVPVDRMIAGKQHPLLALSGFNNGVPMVPMMKKCFFSADGALIRSWMTDLTATGPASFFAWLNAPAEASAAAENELPVSNLALFIYRERPDVRAVYPDLASRDRAGFLRWFVQYAESEYEIAPVFVAPVAERLAQWSGNANTAGPTPLRATLNLDAPQLTGPAPSH